MVEEAQSPVSRDIAQDPAARRTGRNAEAPETLRSEPPASGLERAAPPGGETTREGIRPTVGLNHSGDEKMLSFVRQVGQRIENLVKSDRTALEIQLVPEQLGKIDLKLASTPQGTSIVIQAENPATGWLLEQNLPQLRQTLAEAGVQLSGLSVGQNGAHSPGSQGHSGSYRGTKPGYRSSANGSPRIEAGSKRSEWADPVQGQGVNYLV
jgi:flagellar hook-length control protein FliK